MQQDRICAPQGVKGLLPPPPGVDGERRLARSDERSAAVERRDEWRAGRERAVDLTRITGARLVQARVPDLSTRLELVDGHERGDDLRDGPGERRTVSEELQQPGQLAVADEARRDLAQGVVADDIRRGDRSDDIRRSFVVTGVGEERGHRRTSGLVVTAPGQELVGKRDRGSLLPDVHQCPRELAELGHTRVEEAVARELPPGGGTHPLDERARLVDPTGAGQRPRDG